MHWFVRERLDEPVELLMENVLCLVVCTINLLGLKSIFPLATGDDLKF